MSILNRDEIKNEMADQPYENRLVITPILADTQFGPASVDVRLGSSIIIPRKSYADRYDVTDRHTGHQVEQRLYDKIRLRYGTKFMLHPNQLILAVTFEYLSIPAHLFCIIMSRSSWGRLGLVVATAAAVQPGYKGCLTLELVNLSESPIALYPGLPVGQLVVHEVSSQGVKAVSYDGRYDCPTDAEMPKFHSKLEDNSLYFWGNPKE